MRDPYGYLGNQFITLHGERPSLRQQAQFNHMRRMHHTHAIAELFTLQYSRLDGPQDQLLDIPVDMEPELAMILYTYRTVFDVPSGLPPSRTHNHSIPLVEGAGPVKVKPYRYPHSRKD